MSTPVRAFTQEDLADALDRGLTPTQFAAQAGCSDNLVRIRIRTLRIERGEPVAKGHDLRWDHKLRAVPKRAQVLALLASHGAAAVMERWGGESPSQVLQRARA